MYEINFYRDEKEKQPVKEYITSLKSKTDKNSKMNYRKILDIIKDLSEYGLNLGMSYIRRINSDIWEMRPMRNRILFYSYKNDEFVLLHYFVKKTNKTPKREIEKAENEMNYYKKWRCEHEKQKNEL